MTAARKSLFYAGGILLALVIALGFVFHDTQVDPGHWGWRDSQIVINVPEITSEPRPISLRSTHFGGSGRAKRVDYTYNGQTRRGELCTNAADDLTNSPGLHYFRPLHGPGDCTTNAPYPFAHPEPVSNGEWNDVVRFVHPNGGSHYITIEIDGVIEDPVKTWFIF